MSSYKTKFTTTMRSIEDEFDGVIKRSNRPFFSGKMVGHELAVILVLIEEQLLSDKNDITYFVRHRFI